MVAVPGSQYLAVHPNRMFDQPKRLFVAPANHPCLNRKRKQAEVGCGSSSWATRIGFEAITSRRRLAIVPMRQFQADDRRLSWLWHRRDAANANLCLIQVLILLVIAGLLVVIGVSQPLAIWLRLPPAVVLAAIGVAIGALPLVLRHLGLSGSVNAAAGLFAHLPVSSATFIYVFLPLLVFEAGITTDVRRVLDDAAAILVLAVVATLITTAVIGIALWPFAPVPLVVCLLLGSAVSTTDPAAVIAIFRDVGASARLTRLVEGEALLNDAAAISVFVVLLGMIQTGQKPDVIAGLTEFVLSFIGGGVVGLLAGQVLLWLITRFGDDRLVATTLTLAFAYLSFIAAERLFHVSGVVAVLVSGLTVSAVGPSRIAPENWSFLVELWEQLGFWARSLIFVLASMLVSRLLVDIGYRDVLLLAILLVAALGARIFSLFVLMPPLERLGWVRHIETSYKLAIVWGGLARRVDFGPRTGNHGKRGPSTRSPALCGDTGDRHGVVYALRQRHDVALCDPHPPAGSIVG